MVIFGIGELAQLARYYFEHDSNRTVAGFTADEFYVRSSEFQGLPLVSFDRVHEKFPPSEFDLFVAIGYDSLNASRAEKCATAVTRGYALASYVSTRASVWPDLIVGANCFIMEDNTIQPFVKIGDGVIVWCGSTISHHVEIGDYSFIAAEVTISGGVKIGSHSFVGVNATLREHVTIGRDCIVGAGALILGDTPAGSSFVVQGTTNAGIPSRRMRSIL
jgi:sugar O-acyltransferase (sialic acid O-acetyltransferase NeuD family)